MRSTILVLLAVYLAGVVCSAIIATVIVVKLIHDDFRREPKEGEEPQSQVEVEMIRFLRDQDPASLSAYAVLAIASLAVSWPIAVIDEIRSTKKKKKEESK